MYIGTTKSLMTISVRDHGEVQLKAVTGPCETHTWFLCIDETEHLIEYLQLAVAKIAGGFIPGHKKESKIEHPDYYGGKDNQYEAIQVIEAWNLNFCLGNVVKYISRAGKKPQTELLDDLKKAAFYLKREIESREKQ
jgi:Protein of unknwon function (DUF3310)